MRGLIAVCVHQQCELMGMAKTCSRGMHILFKYSNAFNLCIFFVSWH